tara:strand:- start:2990 stop:3466 length:477 start_codon:yes stop_codon:yes gene_type:complete
MSNGKVYLLKSNNSNICYIGSCKNYISTRLAQHKYYYKKWTTGQHDTYRYSSFLVYIDDPEPEGECLEKVEGTKEQVRERENYWINEYKSLGWDVVNLNCPIPDKDRRRKTSQRYYQAHKDEKKKYYQLNRDKILAKANAKYVPSKKKNIYTKDIDDT